ncbi:MAG: PH domain-containing protein [Gemmataceae bacterium]
MGSNTFHHPKQAITGLVPPQVSEACIREAWPTVLGVNHLVASLASQLIKTVVLAPVGFLLLLPLFALKFAPFLSRRYTLTNRRVMIQRGWRPSPGQSVALAEIEEVHLDPASIDAFFHSGNLEIISDSKIVLRLTGVPEPEGFRRAVLNAVVAWVPRREAGPFQPASATRTPGPTTP